MTKHPPITSKRALPNLYLFKTLPPTPNKKCTTTKEPTNWPTFLFIQNAPPLTSKKAVPKCAFIQNAPPTSKQAVTTTIRP